MKVVLVLSVLLITPAYSYGGLPDPTAQVTPDPGDKVLLPVEECTTGVTDVIEACNLKKVQEKDKKFASRLNTIYANLSCFKDPTVRKKPIEQASTEFQNMRRSIEDEIVVCKGLFEIHKKFCEQDDNKKYSKKAEDRKNTFVVEQKKLYSELKKKELNLLNFDTDVCGNTPKQFAEDGKTLVSEAPKSVSTEETCSTNPGVQCVYSKIPKTVEKAKDPANNVLVLDEEPQKEEPVSATEPTDVPRTQQTSVAPPAREPGITPSENQAVVSPELPQDPTTEAVPAEPVFTTTSAPTKTSAKPVETVTATDTKTPKYETPILTQRQKVQEELKKAKAEGQNITRAEARKIVQEDNPGLKQAVKGRLTQPFDPNNPPKETTPTPTPEAPPQPVAQTETSTTAPVGESNPPKQATRQSDGGGTSPTRDGNIETGNRDSGEAPTAEKTATTTPDTKNKQQSNYNPFESNKYKDPNKLLNAYKSDQDQNSSKRNSGYAANGNPRAGGTKGNPVSEEEPTEEEDDKVAMGSRPPTTDLTVEDPPPPEENPQYQAAQPTIYEPTSRQEESGVRLSYEDHVMPAPPPAYTPAAQLAAAGRATPPPTKVAAYHPPPRYVRQLNRQTAPNHKSQDPMAEYDEPVSEEPAYDEVALKEDGTYSSAKAAVGNVDDSSVEPKEEKEEQGFLGDMKDKLMGLFMEEQTKDEIEEGIAGAQEDKKLAKTDKEEEIQASEDEDEESEYDEEKGEEPEGGFLATIADLTKNLFDSSRWFGAEEEDLGELVYEEDDIYADIDPVFDTVQATDGIIDVDAQETSIKEKSIQQLMREAGHIKSEGLVEELPNLKTDVDAYGLTY